MKGDFSRQTFDPKKHYSRVLMQQGRVQLDADWNEEADINVYQAETRMLDLTGGCGGPMHAAAFGIKPVEDELDFMLTPGRYYVDGILCENDTLLSVFKQPDLFLSKNEFVSDRRNKPGLYVAYLDVWQRHLTAIDDPGMREVALGGPDTATRVKTVWQVKLIAVSVENTKNPNCLTSFAEYEAATRQPTGKLTALQATPKETGGNLCIVPPGAGYQGLENQLYRVEIHQGGAVGTATFKWSRENGSVVTTIEKIDGNVITVRDVGPDGVLGFVRDQWVEIIDDARELNGQPGELRQIDDVVPAQRVIKLKTAATPLGGSDGVNPARHPKLRRWDYGGTVAADNALVTTTTTLDLENGVQVEFSKNVADTYRTGDYWLIPARTATADAQSGNIEWPRDPGTNQPLALPPQGIKHHYCRIALVNHEGTFITLFQDCRKLFPPVTELNQLFYVSGDGQEIKPDTPGQNGELKLGLPFIVGVSNGRWPVEGALVRFEAPIGRVDPGPEGATEMLGNPKSILMSTNNKGLASCLWSLAYDKSNPVKIQTLQATLRDADDQQVHLPVNFNANLSLASGVAYLPSGKCDDLKPTKTVQEALDVLCERTQGGGCSVTVGENGEFKTLLDALRAMLRRRQFDLCICMLPGEHTVEIAQFGQAGDNIFLNDDKFSVSARAGKILRVKIEGCGSGTRILWSPKSVGTTFALLSSLTLRDLDINVENSNLNFLNCDEVTLESCDISQKRRVTDDEMRTMSGMGRGAGAFLGLLSVEGYKSLRIEHCRISQTAIRPNLQTYEIFLDTHPPLAEFYVKPGPAEMQDDRIVLGINLASLPARTALAARINDMVANANADTIKKFKATTDAMVRNVTGGLSGSLTVKDHLEPLKGISIAGDRQTPGIAISILDGFGKATLHDNIIEGVLCFYDIIPAPWKEFLDAAVTALFKQGGVNFTEAGNQLSVRNNRLTRVAVGRALIGELDGFSKPNAKRDMGQVFRTAFFGENDIKSPINQFAARHLSLSSNILTRLPLNFLPQPPVLYSHLALARSAVYVGNYGTEAGTRLADLSRTNESAQSANVNLNISTIL